MEEERSSIHVAAGFLLEHLLFLLVGTDCVLLDVANVRL
jgi:hypothetical protein